MLPPAMHCTETVPKYIHDVFCSESTYQRPKINWAELSAQNEVFTAERWNNAMPMIKDFYHEDPEVANMHPTRVAELRLVIEHEIGATFFKLKDNSPRGLCRPLSLSIIPKTHCLEVSTPEL